MVCRMTVTLDAISDQALDLPPAQRLNLARTLIESVDGTEDASPEAAWDSEIKARLARFQAGETTSIPAADVFRRLREIAPGVRMRKKAKGEIGVPESTRRVASH